MKALLCAIAAATSVTSVVAVPAAWLPQGHMRSGLAELRGLSVLSEQVAWASGAQGTVLRTADGKEWQLRTVPGAETLDFRDIQAFDANTAIVMGAGPGAASRLYRTRDGGASWQLLHTNPDSEGFWDAMAFWDAQHGIVFGDPVHGAFQVLVTDDGGDTWQAVNDPQGLAALPQEGAFAASGTCLNVAGSKGAWFVTGGAAQARVFRSTDRGRSWHASSLPIPAGAASKGAFSVAFSDPQHGMVVGGDYREPGLATLNGASSDDGGITWKAVPIQPAGFLSAVAPVPGTQSYVAVGLAGTSFSRDGGRSWQSFDREHKLNAVAFATPDAGWAVGPKGQIVRYVGPPIK